MSFRRRPGRDVFGVIVDRSFEAKSSSEKNEFLEIQFFFENFENYKIFEDFENCNFFGKNN